MIEVVALELQPPIGMLEDMTCVQVKSDLMVTRKEDHRASRAIVLEGKPRHHRLQLALHQRVSSHTPVKTRIAHILRVMDLGVHSQANSSHIAHGIKETSNNTNRMDNIHTDISFGA